MAELGFRVGEEPETDLESQNSARNPERMRSQSFSMSEMDDTEDMHEALFAKRGCCFLMPCLASSQSSSRDGSLRWQRIGTVEPDERWWIRGWKKMREWSELIAGPKWKTFIRRFGRNHCCCGEGGGRGGCGSIPNRSDHCKFRYDPMSYSLNFDDGKQTDEEFSYRDYSKRFAAPSLPVSTKGSLDFDSERDVGTIRSF